MSSQASEKDNNPASNSDFCWKLSCFASSNYTCQGLWDSFARKGFDEIIPASLLRYGIPSCPIKFDLVLFSISATCGHIPKDVSIFMQLITTSRYGKKSILSSYTYLSTYGEKWSYPCGGTSIRIKLVFGPVFSASHMAVRSCNNERVKE